MSKNDTDLAVESMKHELARMIEGAQSADDEIALRAFQSALAPYFQEPQRLRSAVGKIQRMILSHEQQQELETRSFESLDELRALLPADLNVQVEA